MFCYCSEKLGTLESRISELIDSNDKLVSQFGEMKDVFNFLIRVTKPDPSLLKKKDRTDKNYYNTSGVSMRVLLFSDVDPSEYQRILCINKNGFVGLAFYDDYKRKWISYPSDQEVDSNTQAILLE